MAIGTGVPATASEVADTAQSLTDVLGKNEHVKELVEESAESLNLVNQALKTEIQDHASQPGVKDAIEKSEQVECKVADASEKLSVINRALEGEVTDRRTLENQLAEVTRQEVAARHASFHDALTGLPNRALFVDRLVHGLAQAKRHQWMAAIMFMDLDSFKSINDTHGHAVGDFVLQTIAGRLSESTRGDDTVSRHGGDEFLYLLMGVRNEQDIANIADKIINAIKVPFEYRRAEQDVTLSITPSIGISIYPKNGSDPDQLLDGADKAMYQAKRSRSGYSFAP